MCRAEGRVPVTLQERHRARIRAAMERRGLTCKDVATLTGLHERTVQRFVDGRTFSLETLERIEATLRIVVSAGGTTTDSNVPERSKSLQVQDRGPVVGWEQAAHALGIGRVTLFRRRREHKNKTETPWWRSVDSLQRWYQRMIGQEEE